MKTEDDPLDPSPVEGMRKTSAAMTVRRSLQLLWPAASLRYGSFYGAGMTGSSGPCGSGSSHRRLGRRDVLLHPPRGRCCRDRASARARWARDLQHRRRRARPVREWLPVLADALGAKPPRHFPVWLARLIVGEAAVMPGTEARGASNAKAKREPLVAEFALAARLAQSTPTLKREGQPRDRLHPRRHAEAGRPAWSDERFCCDRISRTRHRLYRDADRSSWRCSSSFRCCCSGSPVCLPGWQLHGAERNPSINPREWRDEWSWRPAGP